MTGLVLGFRIKLRLDAKTARRVPGLESLNRHSETLKEVGLAFRMTVEERDCANPLLPCAPTARAAAMHWNCSLDSPTRAPTAAARRRAGRGALRALWLQR